jgi:mannan endo-1,4-beta-mannosidase
MLSSLLFSAALAANASPGLVKVHGAGFELDGAPYRFVGTNFWYGMNLDAARLDRELDKLNSLGITNLRVMAASEGPDGEPWRMNPALQKSPGQYNDGVLAGLDRLMAGLRKRRMKAVVVLNNFWPWSGGMAQYLAWAGKGPIPYPPPAGGGSWSGFEKWAAAFYSDEKATALFSSFVKFVVPRYKDEPAIMAWELANEPRPGGNDAAFDRWIVETAALIKKLDPNHLVTTGSEGLETFEKTHAHPEIDYATIHVWAQNWGWFDPASTSTFSGAETKMRSFISEHAKAAGKLGKPLVLEEFGLARDAGSCKPDSTTSLKDRYYADVLDAARKSSPAISGINFWAWSGEARPPKPCGDWKRGDPWLGDPPHEPQGWYGVYDADTTVEVLKKAALSK